MWALVGALAIVALAAVAAALYFGLRGNGKSSSPTTTGTSTTTAAAPNPLNKLPGIRRTKAPWPPEYAHLTDRLLPLGLTALSAEVLTYHIHQHLDIFLNGKHIAVPALIGINDSAYITELHTHDPTGIVHVESATNRHYTLGTFFAEWGVFLNGKCIGGYCQGYSWYVNGKKQTDSPADLELRSHQEIAIVIGKPPKKIPNTYNWTGL